MATTSKRFRKGGEFNGSYSRGQGSGGYSVWPKLGLRSLWRPVVPATVRPAARHRVQRLNFSEESVTVRHTCDGPSCHSVTKFRTPFSFNILASLYTWCFLSTYHRLGSSTMGAGSSTRGACADSELLHSSDECWWSWTSDLMASWEAELETVGAFDLKDWVDPEANADPKPEAEIPSQPEASPDAELVSVRSSSDWEAATLPGTTLRGVTLVTRAAGVRVMAPEGTYSGSYSLSKMPNFWQDGATDLDFLFQKNRSFLGAICMCREVASVTLATLHTQKTRAKTIWKVNNKVQFFRVRSMGSIDGPLIGSIIWHFELFKLIKNFRPLWLKWRTCRTAYQSFDGQ